MAEGPLSCQEGKDRTGVAEALRTLGDEPALLRPPTCRSSLYPTSGRKEQSPPVITKQQEKHKGRPAPVISV